MQVQQALVIGLGQFGMALVQALSARGVELLVVDANEDRVQLAADHAAEAATFDAMDEAALARLQPAHRDLCVCAIGDEAREASIIVTALLRQLGAPRVVARATDDLHARILHLVGAHEVVNPERDFGQRLAARLADPLVREVMPIGESLSITELTAPPALCGRPLVDLRLPGRFGLTLIAVRRPQGQGEEVVLPRSDLELVPGDVLLLAGAPGATRTLLAGLEG